MLKLIIVVKKTVQELIERILRITIRYLFRRSPPAKQALLTSSKSGESFILEYVQKIMPEDLFAESTVSDHYHFCTFLYSVGNCPGMWPKFHFKSFIAHCPLLIANTPCFA